MPDDSGKGSFTQLKIWSDKADEEKIVGIAAGYMYVFFVTDQGNLYARGEDFLALVKQPSRETTKINLPQGFKARKVWCTKTDAPRVVFVQMEEEATGKKAIYTAGTSEYGCLA